MKNGAETEAGGRKRGSGVTLVYDTLRREIIDLKLAPGTPIDEAQLAERFSLSRTPIREALVRLAAENLITTLTNRATIVSQIDFLNLSSFFDALTLMYRVTTREAALNRSAEDIEKIRKLQAEFARSVAARAPLDMIATNREFHVAIARAGGNKYFTDLFTRLLDEGQRILRLYYSSFNDALPRQYVTEHEDMIAAIEAGDVARADALAVAHADQIVGQIRSYISADRRPNLDLEL
ncbi:GntR family transcriptional regulator [Maritimibacter fusiformis]|uniref:GntR family transcriptional regulator n=1 Tax=Maritimibacter fusiformis TaxID=2603819 RepID=A0A5D0RKV6_9RHOB|nr:GntR family transcriptional regulator [Maritimibacter fusiformis]TYB82257.1 GntR family transcriptional regulator [Maritimibacter fusiformis]